MFPVLVTVNTPEQLKAVYALLGDGAAVASTDAASTPATNTAAPTKSRAAKVTATAQTAPATPTTPVAPVLSAEGKAFLQSQLAGPVTELAMKDEPKMKAICAEYGVERVSLIPEKLFPEVLAKVQNALDPGAAERKRLEAIDAAQEGAPKTRSLL